MASRDDMQGSDTGDAVAAHPGGRAASVRRGSALSGIIISTLFVALIVGVLVLSGVDEQILQLLAWLDAQGGWASLLFILLMALVVVLLLPGVLFTTGAGFVFGVVEGSLYVVAGTTLGAILAFLMARHLFGARASRFVLRHARLKLLNDTFSSHGWKVVMLTRLVPFFPFKLSNYFFGLAGFSLRDFSVGTLLGVIPFSVHNVYLGSIAADIATLGSRDAQRTPLEWGLYLGGFLLAVAAVLYLNRLARRALDDHSGPGQENGG